ncbi:MAG: signal peptidase I [Chlamydiales bacterium]
MKKISIRRMREYLVQTYSLYRKKEATLSICDKEKIESSMRQLQGALSSKDKMAGSKAYYALQSLSKEYLKKPRWASCIDYIGGFFMALFIAIAARGLWFELYQIPTGSMRPTFCEEDRVIVSKTAFGINMPLMAKHLYFDPDLINRNGIFIFTGENIDISNGDMRYFYLFPGKKQYIKRLIGKPGDILYFYGGKIYGIDKEKKDITSDLNPEMLQDIEHIPYLSFEGRVKTMQSRDMHSQVTLSQMNLPIAELSITPYGKAEGKLLPKWEPMENYFNIWGCKNYGMVRLLTAEQVFEFAPQEYKNLPKSLLYAEILHHPDIKKPFLGKDLYGRVRPIPSISKSYLPLQEIHVRALFDKLNTSRFVVKGGKGYRYGASMNSLFGIPLVGVPDGMYEFIAGTPYQIYWKGVTRKLSADHPLAQFNISQTQALFNIGIEFDARYLPKYPDQNCNPARYCYFKEGDLYFLAAPILRQSDPELISFVSREKEKQKRAFPNSYFAFLDSGPPLKVDGSIDKDFIAQYGLRIPDGHYLALGDNHAMSADSRDFGFVPQNNIRGAPKLIFWPFGERMGKPIQAPYPIINFPRTLIWSIAIISFLSWNVWKLIRQKFIFKKIENTKVICNESVENSLDLN